MTAPKQAEAVMTSIPKFVSSIPEKPVAECNPSDKCLNLETNCASYHFIKQEQPVCPQSTNLCLSKKIEQFEHVHLYL